jgi:hypothetical protein
LPSFVGHGRFFGRCEPAVSSSQSLATIETAVDENPGEPDLKRPGLAVRFDAAEDLDERILNGLVGLSLVAKVLVGDPEGPSLVRLNKARRAVPCEIPSALSHEPAYFNGQACVGRQLRPMRSTMAVRGFRWSALGATNGV